MVSKEIRYIDLFAGIGGFRYSFDKQGCKCVFSSEIDEKCRNVYKLNYGDEPSGDITEIDEKTIPDFDILCAGFPCQPFSICGKQGGFSDTRGTLFFDICRIIKEKNPKVVFLENVKHLINHDNKQTITVIISSLKELGYNVVWDVLNSSDFGVPQSRERVIIIATKTGFFDFSKLEKKERKTIREIMDESGSFEILDKSEYTLLDEKYIRTQSTGLRFCGYRNKGQWKRGVRPNTEHLSRVHRQPNRIYSVDGIHPTLPSQESSGRFWIYDKKTDVVRKLTINECYKLMGFPDSFKRISSVGDSYRQLGNSVVIPMIESIAKEIIRQGFNGNEFKENTGRNIQGNLF